MGGNKMKNLEKQIKALTKMIAKAKKLSMDRLMIAAMERELGYLQRAKRWKEEAIKEAIA